jgi:hypothetical protein
MHSILLPYGRMPYVTCVIFTPFSQKAALAAMGFVGFLGKQNPMAAKGLQKRKVQPEPSERGSYI